MLAPRWSRPSTVVNRIDELQSHPLSVHLGVGLASVEETADNGDDLAGQIAVGDLVLLAVDAEGAVLSHAPLHAHEERLAQGLGGDEDFLVVLGVDGCRGTSEEPGVRRDLVVAAEPGAELLLDLVK